MENGTPLFWVELIFKGSEDAMIFYVSIFIFCLEPTVRERLDENSFHHCYGIFFFESIMPKLLDQTTWNCMFKVILQQLQDNLTTVFETVHYSWRFYGHGSPYELVFSSVNVFKQKSVKVSGLISFTQQSKPALRRTMQQDISLIIVCFFFSQVNLVYKFLILLFRKFLQQFIYLFTFWYSVYVGVNPEPSHFL